jgi:prolyl-tRNA editing enzyme YbaK/EbsC (Cys-tRNA(Pro) deacylase)
MSASPEVLAFLDASDVRYQVEHHAPCFSAQRLAAETETDGYHVAKTVVAFFDGEPVILALPAPLHVDLALVARQLGARCAWFARPSDLRRFGAGTDGRVAPPPLPLWSGVRLHADASLLGREEIVFAAGDAHDSIRMRQADWLEVARPTVGTFARRDGEVHPAGWPWTLDTVALARL